MIWPQKAVLCGVDLTFSREANDPNGCGELFAYYKTKYGSELLIKYEVPFQKEPQLTLFCKQFPTGRLSKV
jgi:hypothetical protein